MSITLSQPFSGKVSKGAPHAAPALLIKIFNFSSFFSICLTNLSISFISVRSVGIEIHSTNFDSSSAFKLHCSDFLDVIYVLTPFFTKPSAIIAPIPLDPPVTRATLPLISNKFSIISSNIEILITNFFLLYYYLV